MFIADFWITLLVGGGGLCNFWQEYIVLNTQISLGTFFPLYASMVKGHQTAIQCAFIPTMRILFDAPVTSPLAEIGKMSIDKYYRVTENSVNLFIWSILAVENKYKAYKMF